jgi:iron(III) transport system substrate-binding protein
VNRYFALLSLLLVLILVSAGCTPVSTPAPIQATSQAAPNPEPESEPAASPDPEPEATRADDSGAGERLVLYSGRSETLVGPLLEKFEAATGIDVDVKYGSTAELAATLLEEGANSPADLFWAQDPGGLGAVQTMLEPLPEDILARVDPRWRDPEGRWIGLSGRARTLVYNTEQVQPADLPKSLQDLTDPQWKGRIGWAPSNASFQTMVTAMRTLWGEEPTRAWLASMLANEPVAYERNSAIVEAVAAGEVDIGLVNHYYLYPFLKERGDTFPARNLFLNDAGPGSLVMVAGAGILNTAQHAAAAQQLLAFLLENDAQQYFAGETFEYPVIAGVATAADLPALASLNSPAIDLADLADLQGSVRLLQDVGVLP